MQTMQGTGQAGEPLHRIICIVYRAREYHRMQEDIAVKYRMQDECKYPLMQVALCNDDMT